MIEIILSKAADADLDAILDYGTENYGRELAQAYFFKIDAAMMRVADYPDLGVDHSNLSAGLRSYPAGEHRIYYVASPRRILIVRILHKAMDARRHI